MATHWDYDLGPNQFIREFDGTNTIHAMGSVVKVKQTYRDKMKVFNKYIGKYYEFINREDDGKLRFCNVTWPYKEKKYSREFFESDEEFEESKKYEYYLHLSYSALPGFVEEYVEDIKYEIEPIKFKFQRKDWEVEGMMIAWAMFAVIFIGTLIFNGAWMFQIIEMIIFNAIRKEIRKDDN